MSQGLKPRIFAGFDVRTEVRTYLRGNGKSKSRGCGGVFAQSWRF